MKKNKLETLVSVANIVSSIALIISIIILINEYKRSGVLNEKTIENLVYERMMELDRLVIENKDLGDIIVMAKSTPDSLTESDSLRYLAYEHIFYDSWETLWVGYQNDMVKKETWDDWNEWFLKEYRNKPDLSWQGNLDNFSTNFLRYIKEDLIKN